MKMKKVFICSPYRGDVERNVALAKANARFAAHCGYCPVVPHLMYPQFLKDSDPDERILGITLGVELMKICDEVWIFGSTISNGMAFELEHARKFGIPIRVYSDDEKRIYPEAMMIDDRLTEEFCKAIYCMRFV